MLDPFAWRPDNHALPIHGPVRVLPLLLVAGSVLLSGQGPASTKLDDTLRRLFPGASEIAPKAGEPPHFTAYIKDPRSGQKAVAGFAFLTTELAPLERGYDGPIKMIVGMDTKGVLTGIVVLEHHEPFGSFSIEPPKFAEQFVGKHIPIRSSSAGTSMPCRRPRSASRARPAPSSSAHGASRESC
jgi:hypothetical protein